MNQTVALFLANGFEEIEALTVSDILRRAGIPILLVAVSEVPRIESSHGIVVETDTVINRVNFDEVDMIVLPGGMPGTLNLEANETLMKNLDSFYQNGKKISAICAAPSILGHRGMLKGKKACCFPGFEKDLEGADVKYDSVVKDGEIITARGMGCAIDFALKILETYQGADAALEMSKKIVYR